MYTNQEIGQLGEKLAVKFLKEKDYEIICKNFKSKQGEIDIIAKDEMGVIIFIEVKTRTSLEYGNPSEAVDKNKKEHIVKTAGYYLYKNNIKEANTRFDVIEIFIHKGRYKLNHIKQII